VCRSHISSCRPFIRRIHICVAACCSVLQCVGVCCSHICYVCHLMLHPLHLLLLHARTHTKRDSFICVLQCVAVCCSVLQSNIFVAVSLGAAASFHSTAQKTLQHTATRCNITPSPPPAHGALQHTASYYSTFQHHSISSS